MAGDGLEWEFHSQGHYDDLFAEFAQRADTHADVAPMGIHSFPDADRCVGYAVGSGFEGTLPEYHGHVEDGVVFAPMFCAWCVHDDRLSMAERMVQCVDLFFFFFVVVVSFLLFPPRYHDESVFCGHLQTHTTWTDQATLCPTPSCGKRAYSKHALLSHMATVHRLPVCGFARGGPGRRLKLPDPPPPSLKRTLPTETDPVVVVVGRKRGRRNTDAVSPPPPRDDDDVAHGPLASVQVHGMLQVVSGDRGTHDAKHEVQAGGQVHQDAVAVVAIARAFVMWAYHTGERPFPSLFRALPTDTRTMVTWCVAREKNPRARARRSASPPPHMHTFCLPDGAVVVSPNSPVPPG